MRRAAVPPVPPGSGNAGFGPSTLATPLTIAGITVDPSHHTTTVGMTRLDLTPIEYRLLEALARAAGQVVSHSRLLAAGWRSELDPDPLWLKPHLARLRRKLTTAGGPGIESIRAVGWRLDVES